MKLKSQEVEISYASVNLLSLKQNLIFLNRECGDNV